MLVEMANLEGIISGVYFFMYEALSILLVIHVYQLLCWCNKVELIILLSTIIAF
jgi:hypothetical protein